MRFGSYEAALAWLKKQNLEIQEEVHERISLKAWEDSEEYTYISDPANPYTNSGTMYNSALIFSEFKKGIVRESTPYVERRYHEGGTPNPTHPTAKKEWWEPTVRDYQKSWIKIIEKIANKYHKE